MFKVVLDHILETIDEEIRATEKKIKEVLAEIEKDPLFALEYNYPIQAAELKFKENRLRFLEACLEDARQKEKDKIIEVLENIKQDLENQILGTNYVGLTTATWDSHSTSEGVNIVAKCKGRIERWFYNFVKQSIRRLKKDQIA